MTLRRYERYKDSGVEWLGPVPAHWEVLPIKRLLLSIEQGWSPQCENFPANPGQWGVLKVGCVNGGSFNADENKALPEDLEPLPDLAICRGDVLVSRANTRDLVGSVAVVERDYEKLLLCDKLYRLRVMADRCEPTFLAHFVGGSAARSVIEAAATGASSSMLNIGQGAIVCMPIALPPLQEQRALLRFLGHETAKIDALIAEQQRLIELLTEKRQAVIAHAVTKGLNPAAPMKASGVEWLGGVPSHWPVGPLRRAFSSIDYGISESLDVEGRVAVLRMGNIGGGEVILEDLKYVDSVDAGLLLRGGDLLFNRTNSLEQIGKVGLFRTDSAEPTTFASYLVRLRTAATSVPEYFAYLLNCSGVLGEARANAIVAIGQCNLNPTRYGAFIVAVPPRVEQLSIATFLDAECAKLDLLMHEAGAATELLRERRSALISAAVTGQIDVRSTGAPEAALSETAADIAS